MRVLFPPMAATSFLRVGRPEPIPILGRFFLGFLSRPSSCFTKRSILLSWIWFFQDLTRFPSSVSTSLLAFRSSSRPLVTGRGDTSWAFAVRQRLVMVSDRVMSECFMVLLGSSFSWVFSLLAPVEFLC